MARSAGAGSPWPATAAFSSVTWAKSRWLASATARITSVNLAASSRPAPLSHHPLERRRAA